MRLCETNPSPLLRLEFLVYAASTALVLVAGGSNHLAQLFARFFLAALD
jgi:hypothetical protein